MNILAEYLDNHKFKLCGLVAVVPLIFLLKRNYMSGPKYLSKQRLDGCVAIVTGSNSGIGRETVLDFAKRGAHVIMGCRDLAKSQLVCDEIRKISKNDKVFVEHLDLESFESVDTFSANILKNYKSINILVNNAGIMGYPYAKTIDGFEKHFQVNYLSHYLLTRKLLERIKSTQQSRIINVTSKLYENGYIYWNDLNMESNYEPVDAYKQSKLCNILFTNQLSSIVNNGDKINVNVFSVSPGIVLTNLGRYFVKEFGTFKKIAYYVFYPLVWFLMKSPLMGAQTVIFCAIEPSLLKKSGAFYRNCKEQRLLQHATNKEDAQRMWDVSEQLVLKWL